MRFKIVFPAGYNVDDINNDNIDVNIILSNGYIFFGTLFTLQNIQFLFNPDEEIYFWATDMLIVKDLSIAMIRKSIEKALEDGCFKNIFSEIGVIGGGNFEFYSSFENIEDMSV